MQQWDRGEVFTVQFKEKVIAWHMMHRQVEVHSQDAARKKK